MVAGGDLRRDMAARFGSGREVLTHAKTGRGRRRGRDTIGSRGKHALRAGFLIFRNGRRADRRDHLRAVFQIFLAYRSACCMLQLPRGIWSGETKKEGRHAQVASRKSQVASRKSRILNASVAAVGFLVGGSITLGFEIQTDWVWTGEGQNSTPANLQWTNPANWQWVNPLLPEDDHLYPQLPYTDEVIYFGMGTPCSVPAGDPCDLQNGNFCSSSWTHVDTAQTVGPIIITGNVRLPGAPAGQLATESVTIFGSGGFGARTLLIVDGSPGIVVTDQ